MSAGEILSIKIKTTFGDDAFVVQRLIVEETLSDTYVVNVYAFTKTASFDGDDLIHTKAGVMFETYGKKDASSKQGVRAYHGLVTHMEHLKTIIDEEGKLAHYFHFQLRPTFWMLKHGQDHRIFQEKSAMDIINEVLGDNGATNVQVKASGGTSVREYCVQYGETHFDFVSRLLEEEGIGYYFTHTESSHTMVLFDKNSDFEAIDQESLAFLNVQVEEPFVDRVFAFGKKSQIAPKAYKTIDYNYKTPHAQLLNSSTGPGFGEEVYEYPGLFDNSGRGHSLADQRMEEIEWVTKRVYGRTSCASLAPGSTFSLTDHPIKEYNKEYAISYVRHEIESQIGTQSPHDPVHNMLTYSNSFEGFLKKIPYRPYRKTKKNRIYSSQTAFVTGDGTEVYGDPMGRIKIKFHWDLRNPDDETSSCWVRVSQSLSGATWGALYMPRIGMEVVVTFINGDPDRPLVTGCVYNKSFMPPYSPRDLPHYMTLKSKTFDDASGSNELRFSDKPGEEEIYLHGQYDMNTVIEHSRTEKMNTGDDTLTIYKGDKSIFQKGKDTMFLTEIDHGDKTLHQKGKETTYLVLIDNGDQITTIKKGDKTTTLKKGDKTTKLKKGNLVINVNGTILIKATKDITIKTPKNIIMKAGLNIEMKAGLNIQSKAGMDISNKAGSDIMSKAGSDIMSKAGTNIMSKAGVDIMSKAGANIKSESGANVTIKAGAMLKAEGGAMAEIKGGAMLKAEGGAMAEVKGGAMASIKGAITKVG